MGKSTGTIRFAEAGTSGVFSTLGTPQPIRDETLHKAKAWVLWLRKRIGPYSGYAKIDEAAGRPSGWAKDQLKKNAQRWSLSVAVTILEALRKCEMKRTEAARAAMADSSALQLAEEQFNHEAIMRTIDLAMLTIVSEQEPTSRRGAHERWNVGGVAMMYDAEASSYIAETVARIMDNLDLLNGARETRMRDAATKLTEFLLRGETTPDSHGATRTFRDACRSAYRAFHGQFDAVTRSNVERLASGAVLQSNGDGQR